MATIEGMENLYPRVYEQFYSSNIRFQEARLAQEQIAQSLANTVSYPYINDWTDRLNYLNSIHEQLTYDIPSFVIEFLNSPVYQEAFQIAKSIPVIDFPEIPIIKMPDLPRIDLDYLNQLAPHIDLNLIPSNYFDTLSKFPDVSSIDRLVKAAGRISSNIVPAMDLPDSFQSLVQNPDTFTQQIQNIAALENTQYQEEYVEISKEDLTTVIESLDPDTSKQILEKIQDENKMDALVHKIKVKFCTTSFKELLSEIQKILTVTVALMIIIPIPNQQTFIASFGAIVSLIEAMEIVIKIFRPDDKNDN